MVKSCHKNNLNERKIWKIGENFGNFIFLGNICHFRYQVRSELGPVPWSLTDPTVRIIVFYFRFEFAIKNVFEKIFGNFRIRIFQRFFWKCLVTNSKSKIEHGNFYRLWPRTDQCENLAPRTAVLGALDSGIFWRYKSTTMEIIRI